MAKRKDFDKPFEDKRPITLGESILPGSPLGGPQSNGFGGVNPLNQGSANWQNPYLGDNSSQGARFNNVSDALNGGANGIQAFLSFLGGRTWDNDSWKAFEQYIMQYINTIDQRQYDQQLTKDQRQYDWNLLIDQRSYNSPTNELARLMGAGISRDAAIQLLSGSGSAGAGSASGQPVTSSPAAAPAVQNTNRDILIANSVMQGVEMVSSLVRNGVDMYGAIQTAKMARSQAYMSQKQIDAFNNVNSLSNYLQDGITQGILTPDDLTSWKNAEDIYRWLDDHKDTNFVKPLYHNGVINGVFGSTLGRELLNRDWNERNKSQSEGELYHEFVNQTRFKSELDKWNSKTAYQNYQYAIGELRRQNQEIDNLIQAFERGDIEIKIANKVLEMKGYEANQAETQNRIFNGIYNAPTKGNSVDLSGLGFAPGSGALSAAYSGWAALDDAFLDAFSCRSSSERYALWTKFFNDNHDVAMHAAALKALLTGSYLDYSNKDLHPIYGNLIDLFNLYKTSGMFDVIQLGSDMYTTHIRTGVKLATMQGL